MTLRIERVHQNSILEKPFSTELQTCPSTTSTKKIRIFHSAQSGCAAERRQLPTAGIPKSLGVIDSAAAAKTNKARPATGSAATSAATEPVPANSDYCPPWAGVAYRPKRARLSAPTRLMHRGKSLEARVDHPGVQQTYNDPVNFPWRCVCRITNAFGKVGSGVLCGPRHILTASHNVAWSTTEPELIEVHRAGTGSQARAFDTFALAYTHIEGNSASSNVLDEDYAVLVTDERLGDRFGWVGTKEYDSDLDGAPIFATMGYPVNSVFPVFQVEQWLDEDAWDFGSGRAMTTSADLFSGQSGSPMFATWSDRVFATAVMSSDDPPARENWCAGGADIVRLVRQARSEHP